MKLFSNRWTQLFFCVCVFVLISGPQYLWALFVPHLLTKFQIPLSELQITFFLVIVCMTFITPVAGYFHDRFKTRNIIFLGLLMCTGSWIAASAAESISMLYISYGVIGGLGAGIAFIGCVGLIQKYFPDRRGFATGVLMSGYALGPMLTTPFVAKSVAAVGVESTLSYFGGLFVVLSFLVILGLRDPKDVVSPQTENKKPLTGIAPKEMLQTPVFWLMFVMMMMIASCGMMIISNIAVIAKESGIGSNILLFGMAALPLALMLDRFTNGLSRIVFGHISDRIGRENTLAIAFTLEGLFMFLWFHQLHNPIMFIILSGFVFLAWGEIFSIFPALCTDIFGEKNASINFGFLYASVGVGSFLGGPVAAYIRERSGSWTPVFYIIIALDLITAVLAFTALKKMRGVEGEKKYVLRMGH